MDRLLDSELYNKVLTGDPSIGLAQVEALLQKYPYSFPLREAFDRMNAASDFYKPQSLLFAPNVFWLSQSVVKEENSVSPEIEKDEEYISWIPLDETEEIRSEPPLSFELEEVADQGSDEEDTVSLYDDELMPYSFRWWLHKTRLEHAETYKPFASEPVARPSEERLDFKKLDDVFLDQQIRASILHYQSPEEKISAKKDLKSVENEKVKKTDQILQRFIKEEPQIKPPSADKLNLENKARKSSEEQFHLVTETLANIYIEQGLYMKASDIFKKLILKYPEKKSYFVERISELEKYNK